jgi:hypothetical protein
MLPKHRRTSGAIAIAVLLADAGLSACSKQDDQDQSSAMSLLRSGSEKTCITPEVQQTLHDMIVPKPDSVASDAPSADKHDAVGGITLAYQNTTLQSFDQAVARATCNTTVHVAAGDRSSDFDLTYTISPSADNSATFVISTNASEAKAFALELANEAVAQAETNREQQERADQEQQARAQLLAMITPKWLVGRWISSTADPSACVDDRALVLAPNHVFSNQGRTGRWAVEGDQLHFVGGGSAGNIDETSTITQADAVSYTAVGSDGSSTGWRRCARSEIEAPTPSGPTVGSALSQDGQ